MKDLAAGACADRADATYATSDPFFPEAHKGRKGQPDYRPAKAICAECKIRELCLEDALATEPKWARYGVRGGTTPEERSALVRSEKRFSINGNAITAEQSEQRMWIYNKGYSDRLAAGYFGLNEASFRNWRRRQGLPANYRSDGSRAKVESA